MKTKTEPSVEDLLEFVLEHRGERAYKGWTDEQIVFEMERASKENTFLYCQEEATGKVIGVVTGRKLEDDQGLRIMHITGIVTSKTGVLLVMYNIFRKLYPRYRLLGGYRKGKLFVWDKKKMDKFEQYLERQLHHV